MNDDIIMSPDNTEAATGLNPEEAFVDAEEYAAEQGTWQEPTQVQEPVQAARRTVVQYLSGVLAALIVAGLVRVGLAVPPDVAQAIGVLVGAVVSWIVAKVMAKATVNAILTRFSLGATPNPRRAVKG